MFTFGGGWTYSYAPIISLKLLNSQDIGLIFYVLRFRDAPV